MCYVSYRQYEIPSEMKQLLFDRSIMFLLHSRWQQPFFKLSLLKLYSVALIPSHSEQRLQTKWQRFQPFCMHTLSINYYQCALCDTVLMQAHHHTVVEAAPGGRGFNPMTSLSALMDICEEREGVMSLFPRGFVEGEVNWTLCSYLCVSVCVWSVMFPYYCKGWSRVWPCPGLC